MFRTREILIRIWILGSLQWITDLDPDPCLFGSSSQDGATKNKLFAYFFLCHINISLDKTLKKEEIKLFLTIFA